MSTSNYVANVQDYSIAHYCLDAPFDPPEAFPEFDFIKKINKDNCLYGMIRNLFIELGLDENNIGTRHWNPFKEMIRPGQRIIIKPNLVTHEHILGEQALFSSIIHGSILRPIIDYIYLALKGEGAIVIADNPVEGADFDQLMTFTGIQAMTDELNERGYNILKVLDLRPKVLKEASNGQFYYENQIGDPLGYVSIDLGRDSMFGEFDANPNVHYYTLADKTIDHIDPRYIGKSQTDDYHNSTTHKYIVSKSILNADTIVNVAKMKSHCKAGVTLTLKNMIGMVYEKNCMPHHRPGMLPEGDSFPDYPASHYVMARKSYQNLKKWLYIHHLPGVKVFRNWLQKNKIYVGQQIEHGNWKGNDTIWRTILDLNRIALYADKDGTMKETPQRNYFALIDGIISQQGEGPMGGDPVQTSILCGGFNPVLVDALAIKVMGLDYASFKFISRASTTTRWCLLNDEYTDLSFPNMAVPNLNFKLSKGWC